MKAMILAAGRGERMGELTATTPKPLLRVGEYTLIERQLFTLQRIGIREVVINVHHLAEQIMQTLGDGARYGLTIVYAQEQELLGTGGGIYNALRWLGEQPFLLVSSDIITNYPFESLLRFVLQPTSDHWLGHLILVDNPHFHPQGDFGIDTQGYLTLEAPKFTYASFAVLHPKLFAACAAGNFSLGSVLLPAITARTLTGEYFQGFWENVGTLEQLVFLNRGRVMEG